MATMNREGGKAPETAKTSFIGGDSFKQTRKTMANLQFEEKFPEYGKNAKVLNSVVDKGRYRDKFVVVGPRGGKTPSFNSEGALNPKLSRETVASHTVIKALFHKRKMVQEYNDTQPLNGNKQSH